MARTKVEHLQCDVPRCGARDGDVTTYHIRYPDRQGPVDLCKEHYKSCSLADLHRLVRTSRRRKSIQPVEKDRFVSGGASR